MYNEEYAEYVDEQNLLRGLVDQPDKISEQDLSVIVEEICEFYSRLKREQPNVPKVFLPGGEWAHYLKHQEEIYSPLLNHEIDRASALLRNFWRNELGPVVKQYAGFDKLSVDQKERQRFSDLMGYDFMIWRNLQAAPVSELAVPPVGNPWGYVLEDTVIAPKVLRYHTLGNQIRGVVSDVARPVIGELGAGYGGTAHFLLRGEDPICYVDFDLPEVLTIAAYYLKRTLPHRKVLLWTPELELTDAVFQENDVVLLPNWMMAQAPERSIDLFLNTFSLSEMPLETITEYVTHVERSVKGYFLHNNMDRQGVVNRGHERVPCSQYPVSKDRFKLLYKRYDLFQRLHFGRDGDYREVLYQKID